jgi:flagellin-like hook-associated protein FlgL
MERTVIYAHKGGTMLGGINTVPRQLSAVYAENNQKLAEILQRIALGKKVAVPSDDFAAYSRAQELNTSVEQYGKVTQDLTEAKGVADVAADAGNSIYDDLARMKELAQLWVGASGEDKSAYAAEFNALKSAIAATKSNSTYEGTHVVASGAAISVHTDPSGLGHFTVDFAAGDIPDASALYISNGTTAVQTELDTSTLYVVKAESFSEHAARQMAMTATIVQSKQSVISLITDIDDAEEMANSTEMSIRQQATIAMIAQANALQGAVARLYGNE